MVTNRFKKVFCRGVYLAENTSQAARVEFVPQRGQIMRAADCKNLSESPKGGFRQSEMAGTFVPAIFIPSQPKRGEIITLSQRLPLS